MQFEATEITPFPQFFIISYESPSSHDNTIKLLFVLSITSFICSVLPLASFTPITFEHDSAIFRRVSVSRFTPVLLFIL